MNAGTPDGFIGDFVSAVYFLHPDGTMGEFKPGAGLLQLPHVFGPARRRDHRGAARSAPAAAAEILKEIKQRLKQKKMNQPLALASAGCVWKNPPGEAAGRLVEKVGLKGKRHNGAEISAKHANFIVNRGGATAADIKALMDMTRERVQSQFGIALETEIKTLGEI